MIIHINMLPGRSNETKEALAAAITEACVAIAGATAEHINIVMAEVSREAWFVSGSSSKIRAERRKLQIKNV